MKKIFLLCWLSVVLFVLSSCSDAFVASSNLSTAADNFELERRIVFYNGITNQYILVIQGRCSIGTERDILSVTCKTGARTYKKHYLGLSDNVTFFSEQLDSVPVDVYHYRVVFKPETLLLNADLRSSVGSHPSM